MNAAASHTEILLEVYEVMDQMHEGDLGHVGELLLKLEQAPDAEAVAGIREKMAALVMLSGEAFEHGRTQLKQTIWEQAQMENGGGAAAESAQAPESPGEGAGLETLYQKLGGEDNLKGVVDSFYAGVLSDPTVSQFFAETDLDNLKRHQARFLSQALGGPAHYDGRSLAEAHQSLGITDEQFETVLRHLANALAEYRLSGPEIDRVVELMETLRGQIVVPHGLFSQRAETALAVPVPFEAATPPPPEAAAPPPPEAAAATPAPWAAPAAVEPLVDKELFMEFADESMDQLETIELNFLALETDPGNKETIDNIFRPFHTIKGVSGFLGLTAINQICHEIESVLDEGRKGKLEVTGQMSDHVLEVVDFLKVLIPIVREADDPATAIGAYQEQVTAILGKIAGMRSLADGEWRDPLEAAKPIGEVLLGQQHVKQEDVERAVAVQEAEGGSLGEILVRGKAAKAIDVAHALRDQHKAREELAQVQKPATDARSEATASVRVRVKLLNQLMGLAGELVLGRNQLLQKMDLHTDEVHGLNSILQALDRVTSEVQEAVMQTRMQPVGDLFTRFHRVVRDLSRSLGKKIDLHTEGETVELDRTLMEALTDPLTHLVRNSCDHGIEMPQERAEAGKSEKGRISLIARHAGGKVHVTIRDDGKGVDPERIREIGVEKGVVTREQANQLSDREALRLLFMPGFSTAQSVTEISGRGVGMDVVLSNIKRIGGTVDISSELGKGTTILLDLPLTLAIVPALIVSSSDQRFAIPQTNILELVHLEPKDVESALMKVRGSEVFSLRGEMLPLVRLDRVLNLKKAEDDADLTQQGGEAVTIIVASTGIHQFALLVDRVFDTEEIVVKPLNPLLKDVGIADGATLMGDGHAALILGMEGLMRAAELSFDEEAASSELDLRKGEAEEERDEVQTLLLFNVNPRERLAVSLNLLSRLETINIADVRDSIQGKVIPYRDRLLPLIFPEEHTEILPPPEGRETAKVLVFEIERPVGLVVSEIVDSTQVVVNLSDSEAAKVGFSGLALVDNNPTAFVDIYGMIETAFPNWFKRSKQEQQVSLDKGEITLLLAEDSSFYRNIERNYLMQEGFHVLEAEDGKEALDILMREPVDLLVTDIEMPHMNGFQLAEQVRATPNLSHIPIIAVTSLSDDAERERGMNAGMNAYLIKLQREQLLTEVNRLLAQRHTGAEGRQQGIAS